MLILGLDLSTACAGVAIVSSDDYTLVRAFEVKPKASWKTPDRCKFIAEVISVVATDPDITEIWAEAIGTRFIQTAMGMGRVHQATAEAICRVQQWRTESPSTVYNTVPPSVLKKFATGKGNADKDMMIAAAVARWPGRTYTDNEADAALIAAYGAES